MNKAARWGALMILSVVVTFASVGVAGAQEADPYVGPSPTVESEVVERGVPAAPAVPSAEATEVAGQSVSTAPSAEVRGSRLAFTGGDIGVLLGVGVAALLAGIVLVTSRRRAVTA